MTKEVKVQEIKYRLKKFLEIECLSYDEAFAAAKLRTAGAIHKFMGGYDYPVINHVLLYAQNLGLNPDWLIHNVGEMRIPKGQKAVNPIDHLEKMMEVGDFKASDIQKVVKGSKTYIWSFKNLDASKIKVFYPRNFFEMMIEYNFSLNYAFFGIGNVFIDDKKFREETESFHLFEIKDKNKKATLPLLDELDHIKEEVQQYVSEDTNVTIENEETLLGEVRAIRKELHLLLTKFEVLENASWQTKLVK